MTWLWGPFVPFAVSRLCRETTRHFGDGWGAWLDCRFKWLERYGREREIVIGVILFHKLIETKRHVDWNVQNLALFAEILVA